LDSTARIAERTARTRATPQGGSQVNMLTDCLQWLAHLITALVVLFWFLMACFSVALIALGQMALGRKNLSKMESQRTEAQFLDTQL
jgi:hypothetical protein